MKVSFKVETEKLKGNWQKHKRSVLRDYLVKDVEDPRINVQSILTRHWLVKQLFGQKLDELMEHEIRFALVMNWLLKLLKKNIKTSHLKAIFYSLIEKQKDAEGIEIPSYISDTFSSLCMPNYICDALSIPESDSSYGIIPEYLLSTFSRIWKEMLVEEQHKKITVLEPACGSANDYRFIDSFGIARFLDYTGFDLCEKNIRNAKMMFPEINFDMGNVIEIEAEENCFDFCFVHDLFEHLSIEAMERAISEICRVAGRGVCIGFFNMHDGGEHLVKSVNSYYWNKLSRDAITKLLRKKFSDVEIINIDVFLSSEYNYCDTHNRDAYILIANI